MENKWVKKGKCRVGFSNHFLSTFKMENILAKHEVGIWGSYFSLIQSSFGCPNNKKVFRYCLMFIL